MSEEIATVEIDEWRHVSPLSIVAGLVRSFGSAIIPLVAVMFGSQGFDGGALFVIPAFVGIMAVAGFVAWLKWSRLRYRVGSNDVRLEQGVLSRSARSVPYDRIQDVSLEQKLIPRLLGLVEVKFETGAGGKDELKLSYVTEAEGELLRETVRGLVDGQVAATIVQEGGEDQTGVDPRESGRVLFRMNTGRLFVFGLFSFSLVVFAVLLGAAQQLEFLLPFDLWDWVEMQVDDGRIAEAGTYVASYNTVSAIVALVWALVTLVVVGVASGVVSTFVRDWEFLLERTAKGFRRRRGLLTKTDVVMPVHRVQALVVKTGWLRRRFGWHGLSFISLAQDAGSANHDVAPFAKMDEIAPIAAEAGFDLPDAATDWRLPSPKYYWDKAVLALALPAIGAVAAILAGYWPGGLALAALGLLLVAREFHLWHFDRHALDPRQVLSRRGWLAPRVQVASRVKLHSVEIAQGPLARWRGYGHLVFGLAGGRLVFRGLQLEDARRLQAAVLDSIAAVDFAKLAR